MRHILKGGRIYCPADGWNTVGDVWIADGVIEGIYAHDDDVPSIPESAIVVDCDGKWIAPGLVDVRTFCGELGGLGKNGPEAERPAWSVQRSQWCLSTAWRRCCQAEQHLRSGQSPPD